MRYSTNVKGSESEARKAAEAHGYTVEKTHAVLDDQTTLIVEGPALPIYAWFGEGGHDAPYPPGTLLCFREDHRE